MRKILTTAALFIIGSLAQIPVQAQSVGLKTNALYWGTTTINFGVEPVLSPHSTIDIEGVYNPWEFNNNRKLKLWGVQPEYRYWICEKFDGHFFGIHAHYGEYNVALNSDRYDGWLVGGGVSYGYNWIMNRHWRLEATIGVGYAYMDYNTYQRPKCGDFIRHKIKNYVGPTKVGISFIYLIK